MPPTKKKNVRLNILQPQLYYSNLNLHHSQSYDQPSVILSEDQLLSLENNLPNISADQQKALKPLKTPVEVWKYLEDNSLITYVQIKAGLYQEKVSLTTHLVPRRTLAKQKIVNQTDYEAVYEGSTLWSILAKAKTGARFDKTQSWGFSVGFSISCDGNTRCEIICLLPGGKEEFLYVRVLPSNIDHSVVQILIKAKQLMDKQCRAFHSTDVIEFCAEQINPSDLSFISSKVAITKTKMLEGISVTGQFLSKFLPSSSVSSLTKQLESKVGLKISDDDGRFCLQSARLSEEVRGHFFEAMKTLCQKKIAYVSLFKDISFHNLDPLGCLFDLLTKDTLLTESERKALITKFEGACSVARMIQILFLQTLVAFLSDKKLKDESTTSKNIKEKVWLPFIQSVYWLDLSYRFYH